MNEDELTTNEQTTDVEQTTAEPDVQQQLPADASPDDLTLEEIVQTSDDDFEDYQKGKITAAAIREKYNFNKSTEDTQEPSSENDDTTDTTADTTENTAPEQDTTVSDTSNEEVSSWRKVSAPFKANGKMYQPRNADDVINLMQKGINYTQKMQQIAPARKAFETLNKNQIDDNELNFLIDLHKGDKGAIKELLKRNNYSANSFEDSFGESDTTTYTPGNNLATEQDLNISSVMADIQDNKAQITDIVLNKWDQASRDLINKDPNLLRLLNAEIELGRFDTIQQQVEQLKMFDRSYGPDIITYANLAKAYQDQQAQQAQQQAVQQAQQQQIAANNAASKKAAAPTRGQSRTAKRKMTTEDIWNMSDEDFEKLKYTDIQAMEQN